MKLPPPNRPAPNRPVNKSPATPVKGAPDRPAPPRPNSAAVGQPAGSAGAAAALIDEHEIPPPPAEEFEEDIPAPPLHEPPSMQEAVAQRYPAVRMPEVAQQAPAARPQPAPSDSRVAAQQTPAAAVEAPPVQHPAGPTAIPFGTQNFIWNGHAVAPVDSYIKADTKGAVEWGFTVKANTGAEEGKRGRSEREPVQNRKTLAPTPDDKYVILSVTPANGEKFRTRVGEWVGVPKGTSINGVLLALSAKSANPATADQYNIPALCAVLDKRMGLAGKVPFEGGQEWRGSR